MQNEIISLASAALPMHADAKSQIYGVVSQYWYQGFGNLFHLLQAVCSKPRHAHMMVRLSIFIISSKTSGRGMC